jgi:hypothetical protein
LPTLAQVAPRRSAPSQDSAPCAAPSPHTAGTVSTVQLNAAGVGSALPAASIARTWNACAPSPTVSPSGDAHAANAAPSSAHSKWSSASLPVNSNTAIAVVAAAGGVRSSAVSGGAVSDGVSGGASGAGVSGAPSSGGAASGWSLALSPHPTPTTRNKPITRYIAD